METIFDRVTQILEESGLSTQRFADKLFVSAGVIDNIKYRRVSRISPVVLKAIENVFDVDPVWLETGEGVPGIGGRITADRSMAILSRRMLQDPDHTGRLLRAVAALGDDTWNAAVRAIEEIIANYNASSNE